MNKKLYPKASLISIELCQQMNTALVTNPKVNINKYKCVCGTPTILWLIGVRLLLRA